MSSDGCTSLVPLIADVEFGFASLDRVREVTRIARVGENGARVVDRDRSGAETALEAPYVLITLPLSVLRSLKADFSPLYQFAINAGDYIRAAKIAFYSARRFWEEDEQIYGGISWTTQDITQVWYPSTNFHGRDGIILGAYIWTEEIGAPFLMMPPAERLRRAIEQGTKLHPNYAAEVSHGVSVAWGNVPFSNGAWCEWSEENKRNAYPVLLEPDGPFFLAGDYLGTTHNETAIQTGTAAAHAARAALGA